MTEELTERRTLGLGVTFDLPEEDQHDNPLDEDKIPDSIHVQKDTPTWPWSFRSTYSPREHESTYRQFRYWVSLGEVRTYHKCAIKFGLTIQTVSINARKNRWKDRLKAYLDYRIVEKAENEREKRHNDHLNKLEQFRVRSEQIGVGLITASAQLLQAANNSILEMKNRNETLDRRLIAGALNASAKCADAGRMLVAQSLGVDALIAGVEGADGDSEAYE